MSLPVILFIIRPIETGSLCRRSNARLLVARIEGGSDPSRESTERLRGQLKCEPVITALTADERSGTLRSRSAQGRWDIFQNWL